MLSYINIRGARPMNEPVLYSIEASAKILSIGRSSLYGLIASGKLRPVKIGRRTLIPDDTIRRFVADLRAGDA